MSYESAELEICFKKSIDRNIGKKSKGALRINEEGMSRPFILAGQYKVT